MRVPRGFTERALALDGGTPPTWWTWSERSESPPPGDEPPQTPAWVDRWLVFLLTLVVLAWTALVLSPVPATRRGPLDLTPEDHARVRAQLGCAPDAEATAEDCIREIQDATDGGILHGP